MLMIYLFLFPVWEAASTG